MIDLPTANNGSEDFAYFSSWDGVSIPATMWFYGSTAADRWDAETGDLRDRMARMPGQHTPFYAPDRLPTLRRGVETLVGAALPSCRDSRHERGPGGDPAAGALARRADGRRRQPRTRHRRRSEGRWPSGVVGVAGLGAHRALLRTPERRPIGSRSSRTRRRCSTRSHYLLGNLDRSYLTKLRARGGLQAYPSRTKDPDGVDFSTGSVGLGAAAPLFAAATRRYVDAHFGPREPARFVAVIGDAELDEGSVWEAVADPATAGLGNVMWVVDLNRQSLDRVVPGIRIAQWAAQFAAAGWHVVEVKYGSPAARGVRPRARRRAAGLDRPDAQRALPVAVRADGEPLRKQFLDGAPGARSVRPSPDVPDDGAGRAAAQDLGGHDLAALLAAYAECDAGRPTGRASCSRTRSRVGSCPTAGHPRNHSALLSGEQIDVLREAAGLTRRH